ncbi:MAG: protein translocase SEC61 complex subunit gamma [Candidatus Methanomethylophilaceae archaeon]
MTDDTAPADDGQENRQSGLGFSRYSRIMKMARTPSRDEYRKTVGITALGIVLLGAVGFATMWLMTYLPSYF